MKALALRTTAVVPKYKHAQFGRLAPASKDVTHATSFPSRRYAVAAAVFSTSASTVQCKPILMRSRLRPLLPSPGVATTRTADSDFSLPVLGGYDVVAYWTLPDGAEPVLGKPALMSLYGHYRFFFSSIENLRTFEVRSMMRVLRLRVSFGRAVQPCYIRTSADRVDPVLEQKRTRCCQDCLFNRVRCMARRGRNTLWLCWHPQGRRCCVFWVRAGHGTRYETWLFPLGCLV